MRFIPHIQWTRQEAAILKAAFAPVQLIQDEFQRFGGKELVFRTITHVCRVDTSLTLAHVTAAFDILTVLLKRVHSDTETSFKTPETPPEGDSIPVFADPSIAAKIVRETREQQLRTGLSALKILHVATLFLGQALKSVAEPPEVVDDSDLPN